MVLVCSIVLLFLHCIVGSNNQGQLGDSTTTSPRNSYVASNLAALAGKSIAYLRGASNTAYLVTTDGSTFITGYNGVGSVTSFTQMNDLKNIVALSALTGHYLALSSFNQLWVGGSGMFIFLQVLLTIFR